MSCLKVFQMKYFGLVFQNVSNMKNENWQYFCHNWWPPVLLFFYMNPTKYCFGNYSSGFTWTICLVSWNIIKLDRFVSNWTAKNRRIWSFLSFITDINESRCNILYFDLGNTCSDIAKWLFVHRLRTDINFHISSPNLGETKSDHIMIYDLIITLRWLITSTFNM